MTLDPLFTDLLARVFPLLEDGGAVAIMTPRVTQQSTNRSTQMAPDNTHLRCEYIYNRPYRAATHTWTVIGAEGTLHLHITDNGEDYKYEQYTSGIEHHWRHPPRHLKDYAPSQDQCWLLKCPCWHDGSSLQASEHWVPLWLAAPHDHAGMFRALGAEYQKQFGEDADAE